MTISSLCDGVILSPNYNSGRNNVTRLTPHHTAGIMTAEEIAACFSSTSRQASCNYAIGVDGSIVCVVDEDNTAWTSSSYDNDSRAITFEISDCDGDWNISDASIESYINLCVDLIRRYPSLGGSYRWTGDFDGNVTVHRWFAATACPGDPLYNMQGWIGEQINKRLSGEREDEVTDNDIAKIINGITFAGTPLNNSGLYYQAHIGGVGWSNYLRDGQIAGSVGQSHAIEALYVTPPKNVNLVISLHIANVGWVDYEIPQEGTVIGTTGQSNAIEAMMIKGDKKVQYRAHVSGIGWQQWKTNGEIAGTTGERRAIEALQIVVG